MTRQTGGSPLLLLLLALVGIAAIQQPAKPTLYLVGDSTVRNGSGKGDGGLWGWGSFLQERMDTTRIAIINNALGGTSSRSYRSNGHWQKTLDALRPGDFVMIQFGHNDGNPTTLKGISNDSAEVWNPYTKQMVMAHTYGWNLRQYIRETRAKGATPVLLSLVPRNIWKEGKLSRVAAEYVGWAKAVALEEAVDFIDLNTIIADHYDALGEQKVKADFFNSKDHVHTLEAGARFNAHCVLEGLNALQDNPLKHYVLR